jgi:hypothetical protein
MHKVLALVFGFALLAGGCSSVFELEDPRYLEAEEILWAGLDYSRVQMVGLSGFKTRDEIVPKYPLEWNSLFVKEQLDDLASVLGKPVQVEVSGIEAIHRDPSKVRVVRSAGTREHLAKPLLMRRQVVAMVKAYKLPAKKGIGMIFIIERLVKEQEAASLFIVLFDWTSREILYLKRDCFRAGGIGFRNYWFRPVKEAVRQLPSP